ncbi:MAG: Na/Pi cotransporter family protein, partial [Candidatus Omnitrophica bacterium]|nr:Na/Pi cotransporter family protein [Candidatus Omnitrophota bacterium]
YIAIAHSAFKIVNTIIFLPFISLLERVSIWLVPGKEDSIDYGTQYLEKHLLDTPPLALEQIHKETIYMLEVAKKAVNNAVNSFFNDDLKLTDKVIELETVTDNLQSEITQYIVDLAQRDLLPEESTQLPVWIHNVNDIERIGDHSQDLAQLTKRKIDEHLPFSEAALKEIKIMSEQIEEMIDDVLSALTNDDIDIAKKTLLRESHINNLQDEFKQSHVKRLNDGNCQLNSGFIFLELIDSLEKIGDRLANIAQSVVGRMKWQLVHNH